MTSPPTPLLNGTLTSSECSASIADGAGNLLFYTHGQTVFNSQHQIMTNGTGLQGSGSTTQGAMIIKMPGSATLYYLITISAGNNGTVGYSIIDMSLSNGLGAVTIKNATLATGSTERMSSVEHNNKTDIWIMSHDFNNSNFRAFLLTSTGITTTVVTNYGPVVTGGAWVGTMKFSPDGQKLAMALYTNGSTVHVFDFNTTTGVVSNSLALGSIQSAYGCEFSPDGSKLYAAAWNQNSVYQWNLCAGSPTAVVASQQAVCSTGQGKGSIQIGPDGKIYVARPNQQHLAVINNPNISGSGCNYVEVGQWLGGRNSSSGLPNLVTSLYKPNIPSFTVAIGSSSNIIGCMSASFSAAPLNSVSPTSCSSLSSSVTAILWNFGDPNSGPNNTSALPNLIHMFSGLGTFSVSLIYYWSGGGGTDTVKQVVTILDPCIAVSSNSITCASLGTATVSAVGGIGPFSYTWTPSAQTGSVATGLSPGSYTIAVLDLGNNYTYTAQTIFQSLIPLTGLLSNQTNLTCFGASNGTATVNNFAGGSGSQHYLWSNGIVTYTQALVNTLSAGLWSVIVTDSLTGCQVINVFQLIQPSALNINISASSASACVGTNITLTALTSGGTPGTGTAYSYLWLPGPSVDTHTVNQSISGSYVYTVSSTDDHTCTATQTIAVDFIPDPVLTVSDVSICPLETGTLTVSGASTYLWNNSAVTNSISDNPMVTTAYSLIGSALGCTSAATASIIIKSLPVPLISSNGPGCENGNIQLFAIGGSSYSWAGPLNFSSSQQNPVLNTIGLTHAGVYDLTVTAANSCTAATSITVVVNPTPTLSAAGATVCTIQNANLNAYSLPGASYQWTGPLVYSSNQQNPVLNNPVLAASGDYTLKATSAVGCTNSAVVNVLVVNPPALSSLLSNNTLCAQPFNGSPISITLTPGGAGSYTLITPGNIFNPNPGGPSMPLSPVAPYSSLSSVVTVTLSGSNGICTVSTLVAFTVIPNPVVTISNPVPAICAGETLTLTLSGALNYIWNAAGPDFTTYNNGSLAVVRPAGSSVFSVYGNNSGCNSVDQTTSITVHPIPTVSITPSNSRICFGTSTLLTAEGTATEFYWSPFTGLDKNSGAAVLASPQTNQTYTILGSANNCTNTAIASITVMALPQPVAAVSKPMVCMNETVILSGSGGETYQWKGPNNLSYGGQTVNFTAGPGHGGEYTLTVTDKNDCMNSTVTMVMVKELPQGSLTGSRMQSCVPFCSDFDYSHATNAGSVITSRWSLKHSVRPDIILKNFEGKTFSHCFSQPGDYAITGKFTDTVTGCLNTETFLVHAFPLPEADFRWLPEKPIEKEEVLFLNVSEGEKQEKFRWYFINNNGYHTEWENATYLFEDAGLYPVAFIVQNSYGCADTIVKTVTIDLDFNFYIPNTFSPNGDNLNDVFMPVMRGVKMYSLMVFDRWGEKVFWTEDPLLGWDGSFRGEMCKEDVYGWKVVLSTVHGERKEFAGHVTLMR